MYDLHSAHSAQFNKFGVCFIYLCMNLSSFMCRVKVRKLWSSFSFFENVAYKTELLRDFARIN